MTSYQLRVSLYPNPPLFDPDETVWREIKVDGSHTLANLHAAILVAFDRVEKHAYEFLTQNEDGMITRHYVTPDIYDGRLSWPLKRADEIERLPDRL